MALPSGISHCAQLLNTIISMYLIAIDIYRVPPPNVVYPEPNVVYAEPKIK